MAQLREPGAALELIDRYLLRSLNLQAIKGGLGRQSSDRGHYRLRRIRGAAG